MDLFIFSYIKFLAEYFDVDPIMLFAIGYVESGFRSDKKLRFEPDFYKKYILGKEKYDKYSPRTVASSYGYMQIMFTTAEMMGFDLDQCLITDDRVNLYYAVKFIKRCKNIWGDRPLEIISAYNAGSPAKKLVKKKWIYTNQKYIDRVLDKINEIKKKGILSNKKGHLV